MQSLFEKEKFDAKRTVCMGVFGYFETVLEIVYWYNFLDKMFGFKQCVRSSIKKTLVDITFFLPFEIILCICWVEAFENNSVSVIDKIKKNFLDILVMSFTIWVPCGFICFYYIPIPLRALFSGVINLGWDMYLTFSSHKIEKN